MSLKINLEVLENIQKSTKLFVPIEKEIKKNDKDGNEDVTTVYYKIKLFHIARFMAG